MPNFYENDLFDGFWKEAIWSQGRSQGKNKKYSKHFIIDNVGVYDTDKQLSLTNRFSALILTEIGIIRSK